MSCTCGDDFVAVMGAHDARCPAVRDPVEREVDAMFGANSRPGPYDCDHGSMPCSARDPFCAKGPGWIDATQLQRLLEQSEALAAEWQETAERYRVELQALRDRVAAVKSVWDAVSAPRGALFAALERLCG